MFLANSSHLRDNQSMNTLVAKRNTTGGNPSKTMNGARPRSLKDTFFATHRAGERFSVRTFWDSFGVTQDSFTRVAGFSPRAVAHWVSGRAPSGSAKQRFAELTRLFDALAEMVDAKAIGAWLKQPNSAFDGSTPLQVIERGETDRIWRMIWELQTGNTG